MRLLKEKNFQTRALTGALFVTVIVGSIILSELSYYFLLFAINLLCLFEFYNLTLEKKQLFFKAYLLFFVSLASGILLFFDSLAHYLSLAGPIFLFLILFLQLAYTSLKPFVNIAFSFLGLIYVSVPLIMLYLLTVEDRIGYNPKLALLLFVLVWVNDTGAYIAGNLFGKTKLFERISPKKTIEGMVGGVVLCIIVAASYGEFILHQSTMVYCGLGFVVGIFATLGDLIESQLKRSINIKDSGTLLPGHGGFLDRFDGFLMAIPAAYFYLRILG